MLKVGAVQLQTNLLLAPIAGYCDLAYRTVCRELGGLGLACTDLLSPQGLLRGTATSLDLAQTNDFDKPVGMQLYGSDPVIMADGARWAVDHGATIVDINMGCPVDKVTKKDGGSRLLCIPDTAEGIVDAVVRAVGEGTGRGREGRGVPVTVKMRLGWFDDQPVARWLAPRLVKAGAAMVTVHGRTTQQRFTGQVNRPGIRDVVEAVKAASPSTPVIGNGDVTAPEHVTQMLAETGCDGVMIGRGALARPWLFRQGWQLQTTGSFDPEPSREEIVRIIQRYMDLMLEFRDEAYALHHIRRRISWLAKPLARFGYTSELKESIRTAPDAASVYAALARFLDDPRRSGRETDRDQESEDVAQSAA